MLLQGKEEFMNSVKRIVIDTCIACSVGNMNSDGTYCRNFLNTFRKDTGHKIVMTPEIIEQWELHGRHIFAYEWLVYMASKKRIYRLKTNCMEKNIRKKLSTIPVEDEAHRVRMIEDLILIEGAIHSDNTVVSMDKKALRLFTRAAKHIGELRNICWYDTVIDSDTIDEWLRDGAEYDKTKLLGARKI